MTFLSGHQFHQLNVCWNNVCRKDLKQIPWNFNVFSEHLDLCTNNNNNNNITIIIIFYLQI